MHSHRRLIRVTLREIVESLAGYILRFLLTSTYVEMCYDLVPVPRHRLALCGFKRSKLDRQCEFPNLRRCSLQQSQANLVSIFITSHVPELRLISSSNYGKTN